MVSPQPADVCWLRFIAAGVFFRRCLTEISYFTTAGQFRRALYSHILYFPFLPLFDPGHTAHTTPLTLRATSKHKAERPFHHQPYRLLFTTTSHHGTHQVLLLRSGESLWCLPHAAVPTHTCLKEPRTAFFAPRILTPALHFASTFLLQAKLGEPVRLALALSGVGWVDDRVAYEDWPSLKPSKNTQRSLMFGTPDAAVLSVLSGRGGRRACVGFCSLLRCTRNRP